MRSIKPGDIAVVVNGLWPNVGRVVYVTDSVSDVDFLPLGIFSKTGWRVRSCSETPLQTAAGLAMAGLTPIGSLRPLDRLPTRLQAELDAKMSLADLADYFRQSEPLKNLRPITEPDKRTTCGALQSFVQHAIQRL